ncbi:MAG: DsbA family protein [Candidatus Bipolaricaulia bacterium]
MEKNKQGKREARDRKPRGQNRFPKIRGVIAAAIVVAGGLIALSYWSATRSQDLSPPSIQVGHTSGDLAKGSPDAPVTVIEFSDFQCPHCANFTLNTAPQLETYINTGKVRWVFRNFPFLGEGSVRAAEAAMCAHEQGTFWAYHDRLFHRAAIRRRGAFDEQALKRLAEELQLDTQMFNNCLGTRRYTDQVQEQFREGQRLGVQGTPTFFINGRITAGDLPLSTFREILEAELANAERESF